MRRTFTVSGWMHRRAGGALCALLICAGLVAGAAAQDPRWHNTYEEARQAASKSGKDIFGYFYTTRSTLCAEIRGKVLTPSYLALLGQKFELYQVDAAQNRDALSEVIPNKFKFPIVVVLYPSGETREIIEDLPTWSAWKTRLDDLLSGRGAKPGAAGAVATPAPELTIDDLFRQGELAVQERRVDRAKEIYRQILAREPSNTRALNNLGALEGMQGHYDRAAEYFRLLLQYDPGNASARANLDRAIKEAASRSQTILPAGSITPPAQTPAPTPAPAPTATPADKWATRSGPSVAESLRLGSEALKTGNLDTAETHYTEALKRDSKSLVALNNLGAIAANRGKFTQAVDFWKRVLAIDPTDQDARKNIELAEKMMNKK